MEQMALQRQRFMEGNAAMQSETLIEGETDDLVASATFGDSSNDSSSTVITSRPQACSTLPSIIKRYK